MNHSHIYKFKTNLKEKTIKLKLYIPGKCKYKLRENFEEIAYFKIHRLFN